MSTPEIVIIAVASIAALAVIVFAARVVITDHEEWRERQEWWDRNDAEKERRSLLDRTIWGAQIPPATENEP